MKEIFISEKDMPISCYRCVCYDGENGRCKVLDTYIEGEHIPRICPLKSLEQLKQQVRREFAEKVKEYVQNKACCGWFEDVKEEVLLEELNNLLKQYEVEE